MKYEIASIFVRIYCMIVIYVQYYRGQYQDALMMVLLLTFLHLIFSREK